MSAKNSAKTALIVEDCPVQASRLERLLAQNGMITMWARDGHEGLHHAQSQSLAVIILDIFLPGGMNGLQLCKSLKENKRTRAVPVILLTQYNNQESANFGLKLGAVEYIPKDAFADAVLLRTLQQMGLIN